MPQRPFPGTIGRTIADSQPWWPPLTDAGGKPPNVLVEDTIIVVLSDNGASQEGGPLGFINAMGPYNQQPEALATKLARIADIGGPDTHSNFPWGWASAANTPLKRYKQNTHGGGIRDPLVISWPNGLAARGELRHGFHHATDLAPTLLDLIGTPKPERLKGLDCLPFDGESFAPALRDAAAAPRQRPQYFEMFGHRGLWADGWKAVAFHPRGQAFDDDVWELYHLDADFNENHDLALQHPDQLQALVQRWWQEAERCQVLPLDDRFGQRFAENGRRVQGQRRQFVMHAGMGHLPNDVAPDLRGRDALIEAEVLLPQVDAEGVLIAHGDATSGYSLYLQGGRLVFDLNVGGVHRVLRSDRAVPPGPALPGSADGGGRLGALHLPDCRGYPGAATAHRHFADRRPAGRQPGQPAWLQQLHQLVGAGHRPGPRLAGIALRRAVCLHRPAPQGDRHAGPAAWHRRRSPGPGRDGPAMTPTGAPP